LSMVDHADERLPELGLEVARCESSSGALEVLHGES
jgi:hypothetical protein